MDAELVLAVTHLNKILSMVADLFDYNIETLKMDLHYMCSTINVLVIFEISNLFIKNFACSFYAATMLQFLFLVNQLLQSFH